MVFLLYIILFIMHTLTSSGRLQGIIHILLLNNILVVLDVNIVIRHFLYFNGKIHPGC